MGHRALVPHLKAMTLYFFVVHSRMMIVGHYLYLFYNEKSDLTEDTLDVMASPPASPPRRARVRRGMGHQDGDVCSLHDGLFRHFGFNPCRVSEEATNQIHRGERRRRHQSPDYSVMAGIPKDATTVSKHFEQFGAVAGAWL